jgi:hypothetical protein
VNGRRETKLISCPKCPPGEHMIQVCAACGWPPALDGNCLCAYPEHYEWYGRYAAYINDSLPRLRALKGLRPSPEDN